MKIRMVSTLAGPDMCLDAGKVYELDETLAKKLVEERHAVYVERRALRADLVVEVADKPMAAIERRDSQQDTQDDVSEATEPVVEHKRRGRPRKGQEQ